MLRDASDGVVSIGPLLELGVVVFVILEILAVFSDGSNMNLIRRTRKQRNPESSRTEADRVTGSDETSRQL